MENTFSELKRASDLGFYKPIAAIITKHYQSERVSAATPPRWISVEERLPDSDVEVLAWISDAPDNSDGQFAEVCHFFKEKWTKCCDCDNSDPEAYGHKITHWMPLPSPPSAAPELPEKPATCPKSD
jgi:hypothetical protein